MPLPAWNDKYSVGVKSIDEQHNVLFDALNDLHAAMMKGQAKQMTEPLLQNLLTYTREHFSAEKAMLMAAKYPAIPDHRARHRVFTDQIQDYIERFQRGEVALNIQLLNFLRDWLSTHILVEDQAYRPWLAEKGIR